MNLWLDEYAHLESPLHRWDPRLKLVALLALIFAFSVVQDLRLLPVMVAITVALYRLSRLPMPFLWTRLRYPGVFLLALAVILPFSGETVAVQIGPLALRQEGLLALLVIVTRFVCILTVGLVLFGTAPLLTTIKAMRSLGLPPLLADMTLLSLRYVFEIGDSLLTMERAMRLRGFRAGRLNRRELGTLASLAGSLLVRSYEQSERVYRAMKLRGYGASPRNEFRVSTGKVRLQPDSLQGNAGTESGLSRTSPAEPSDSPSLLAERGLGGEVLLAERGPGGEVALVVSGLRFSYPGRPAVLQEVSLTVLPGERVGVIGPNGAGKTTLFLAVCGVLKPEAGQVALFGRPVMNGSFRPEVGLVFQNPDDQLFSPSVWDDVAFGPLNMGLPEKEIEARVREALATTGVLALADRPPHHLSGGEKRMVSIAGVLAMQPRLVIYDEPGANLDLRARRRLIRFLQASEQTTLVCSHDLELILEVCDRVILLDEGRVVADGDPRAIMGDAALMDAHGLEKPHSLLPHAETGFPSEPHHAG